MLTMLPVSLDCPFLITHSVFSNVYFNNWVVICRVHVSFHQKNYNIVFSLIAASVGCTRHIHKLVVGRACMNVPWLENGTYFVGKMHVVCNMSIWATISSLLGVVISKHWCNPFPRVEFLLPLSPTRLLTHLAIWVTLRVSYKKHVVNSRAPHLFSFLCRGWFCFVYVRCLSCAQCTMLFHYQYCSLVVKQIIL